MANILVVDDDRDIVSALRIYLSGDEHRVFTAYTGAQALSALSDNPIDLVLMDVMMPEMNGIEALSRLRETYNIPVILLTAKSESSDKVLGLGVGADDYVTKPFDPVELLARVRSQLRRYTRLGGSQVRRESGEDAVSVGGVELSERDKTVSVDGESVSLTPIEFNLLSLLIHDPGRVYSSEEIYQRVWKDASLGSVSAVAVHIRHLREKLEINPAEPRYIKVVWGHGYKFEGKANGK